VSESELVRPAPTSPTSRELLGFRDGDKGTHSSRTLMFKEIDELLAVATDRMSMPDYRRFVVEENILAKRTRTTREYTVRKLKALYGLDPDLPLFRTMLQLWPLDPGSRPLLALLAGYARDPLLRMLTPPVLYAPVGKIVTTEELIAEADRLAPGRFSEINLRAIASRVLSTYTQSGHLQGKTNKIRACVRATTISASYAFYLAYLEGFRSGRIFGTVWAELLDVPGERLEELARDAARRGLIDYRQAGEVVEFRFPNWLLPAEEALTRG